MEPEESLPLTHPPTPPYPSSTPPYNLLIKYFLVSDKHNVITMPTESAGGTSNTNKQNTKQLRPNNAQLTKHP